MLKKGEKTSPMILDSKYKSDLDEKLEKDSEAEIIRQLSGYSREEHIRNQIGAGEEEIVPCVLIYPIKSSDEKCNVWDKQQFIKEELEEYRVDGLRDFYSVPIGIPMLPK